MKCRVPVIGPPPHWQWFPGWNGGRYPRDPELSEIAAGMWVTRFGHDTIKTHRDPPGVYWSTRFSPDIHARTYHWGIVLNKKIAKRRSRAWLRRLLLHELLHWAGYAHDKRFQAAAKQLGTW